MEPLGQIFRENYEDGKPIVGRSDKEQGTGGKRGDKDRKGAADKLIFLT